jgi:radical SAM superfamily enzyme YgiQ (UPF0313 family)
LSGGAGHAAAMDPLFIEVDIAGAPAVYHLADCYRQLGAYVVLGGPRVTSFPEEALRHADTIFLSDREEAWPRFLAEYQLGLERRVYAEAV